MLMQCAWAAVEKKDSYLQAQFYRIKARRGPKKANLAVVASILTAIYHMLKDGTMYKHFGVPCVCCVASKGSLWHELSMFVLFLGARTS